MNTNSPSSSTSADPYHSHEALDPLDEFLSLFLSDIPDVLQTTTALAQTSSFASASEQVLPVIPSPPSIPHRTCYWVSEDNPSFVCGAPLPADPKDACMHYRLVHNIRGNDKATVACLWYGCNASLMQRGSLIRHLLSVHLGLLRWQCEMCGKVFSRKGTGHVCPYGADA